MLLELELNGLNCTNCAEKIQSMSRELDGVESSKLNFVTKKLNIDLKDGADYGFIRDSVISLVNDLEPDVDIVEISKEPRNSRLILELNGLNCSNCAEKIKEMSAGLEGVRQSDLNFVTKKLTVDLESNSYTAVKEQLEELILDLEPDVEIVEISSQLPSRQSVNLELNGLSCTNCAEKIKEMSQELEGVKSVDLNFVTKKFSLDLQSPDYYENVAKKVTDLVLELEPDVQVLNLDLEAGGLKIINLELEGLNCSNCAEKIENFTKALKGVEDARLDIVSKKFKVEVRDYADSLDIKDEIREIVEILEPDVKIIDLDLEKSSGEKPKKSLWDRLDKKEVGRISLAAVLFIIPWLFKLEGSLRFLVYLASYIIIGRKIIKQAFVNVRAGVAFDENFLMTIASMAAFIIGEYPEGVMVMLLYEIGEMMQGLAVNHSRDSISSLMDIRPDYANLERNDQLVKVAPEDVKVGDRIVVRPGEKVPLDGFIVEGSSSLDTSNITGESLPRSASIGDEILSGVVNLEGLLVVEVSKKSSESTVSQILDLVENASSQKADTENFITKFARYYTPVVVYIALALAILPPVLKLGSFSQWVYRASVFLVISCPCALVISVPLGFFGGLGGASKAGVLIKGGNYLEALTEVETVVFDKTGTVTEGVFEVTDVRSYGDYTREEILELAAYGEVHSNHPIGRSIVKEYKEEIDLDRISNYKDIPGRGIDVEIDGEKVFLGNKQLLTSGNIEVDQLDSSGTIVYIGHRGQHIGTIIVSDRIKDSAREDLRRLREAGIKKTIILSGDNKRTVEEVSKELAIDEYYGELLPQDKVEIFESILKAKENEHAKVAFVGDGVNDAPTLARADVGIAMGGLGADAAIEASDIVIMTDDIGKITSGIKIAKNTRKIVKQNIIFALGVKFIVLILGAFGKATMWQAVFADVGVSIIAIINSMRALKIKE